MLKTFTPYDLQLSPLEGLDLTITITKKIFSLNLIYHWLIHISDKYTNHFQELTGNMHCDGIFFCSKKAWNFSPTLEGKAMVPAVSNEHL